MSSVGMSILLSANVTSNSDKVLYINKREGPFAPTIGENNIPYVDL